MGSDIFDLLSSTRSKDISSSFHAQTVVAKLIVSLSNGSEGALLRFLERLENHPKDALSLVRHFEILFKPGSCIPIFTEVGIPSDQGFLANLIFCIEEALLPRSHHFESLLGLLDLLEKAQLNYRFLIRNKPELMLRFLKSLSTAKSQSGGDNRHVWRYIRQDICDSIELLALRIAALGTSGQILKFTNQEKLSKNPFLTIPVVSRELVLSLRVQDQESDHYQLTKVVFASKECFETLDHIIQSLEKRGVDIDVVHRTERLRKSLKRIEMLLALLKSSMEQNASPHILPTLARFLMLHKKDHNVMEVLKSNLRLLARKITEGSGKTGQHYVTETVSEYLKMWKTSFAAGLFTTFTLLAKNEITLGKRSLFAEGFLVGVCFAASFLALQFFGWTLATKQGSMTAAYLAKALSESKGQILGILKLIQRISRSQFVAVCGNLMGVIPMVFLVNYLYFKRNKKPILDSNGILYALKSLDCTHVSLYFFAGFTGLLLWSSSFISGWVENLSVQRRVPLFIRYHPMRNFFGAAETHRLANRYERNIGGIAANVSLGFLLGLAPSISKFFGLALEVRHVTLSAGMLALAFSSLLLLDSAVFHQLAFREYWLIKTSIGVAFVGLINVISSFSLSFFIALRSRDEAFGSQFKFVVNLIKISVSRPFPFFFPSHQPKKNSSTLR